MTILFLHGWKSVPDGVKPTFLAQRGHEVVNPKLPDDHFEKAGKIARRSSTSTSRTWSPGRHEAAPSP